jgi:TatA/E family protein of Tat protein translocase
MFGTLGGQEIIFILVLALIVFGPRKLPEIGKSIGRMMAEFRKASNDFRRTLEDEVEAEKARPIEPPAARTDEAAYGTPAPDAPPSSTPDAYTEPAPAPEPAPDADAASAGVAPPDEPTVARPEPATVGGGPEGHGEPH